MFKEKNDYYLFHPALKTGMELPPPKREHEVGLYERPNYCLYHPFLVHTLEGCAAFKNGLQRHWELGCRSIPNEVLKFELYCNLITPAMV
jgi:hypothetical protein